jgi:hypothetical protein
MGFFPSSLGATTNWSINCFFVATWFCLHIVLAYNCFTSTINTTTIPTFTSRVMLFSLGCRSGVRNYCTPSPLRYALTIKTRLEVELLCSVVLQVKWFEVSNGIHQKSNALCPSLMIIFFYFIYVFDQKLSTKLKTTCLD